MFIYLLLNFSCYKIAVTRWIEKIWNEKPQKVLSQGPN